MAVGITATPTLASAYVSLSVTGLTGFDTLTVTRTDPSGAVTAVRGVNGITISAASWSGIDFECPLDASVVYTATALTHDGLGAVTATGTASTAPAVQLDVAEGTAWLKHLSQTSLSRTVTVVGLEDVSLPARTTEHVVINRARPVVVSDVRGTRKGVITLWTEDLTARSELLDLLDDGQTLLLQVQANYGFPDLYFTPGDVTEIRPGGAYNPVRLWKIAFTEVDSPAGSLTTLPDSSWLLLASFATWQAVLDARASWTAVLNDPSP